MLVLFFIISTLSIAQTNPKILQTAIRVAEVDAMRNLGECVVGTFVAGSSDSKKIEYITKNNKSFIEGFSTKLASQNSNYLVVEATITREKYLKNLENIASNSEYPKDSLKLAASFLPDTIKAMGCGPLNVQGIKLIKARRIALVDAMRNIAQTCCGEIVEKNVQVEKFILTNQEVKSKLEGFQYINGLEVLKEEIKDKRFVVTTSINLRIYKALLLTIISEQKPENWEELLKDVQEIPEEDITAEGIGIIPN